MSKYTMEILEHGHYDDCNQHYCPISECSMGCEARWYEEKIAGLQKLVATGVEVVEDFMPNIAKCVLQDYGRLNTFLMDSDAEAKK